MKSAISIRIAFFLRVSICLALVLLLLFGDVFLRSGIGGCFWRETLGVQCCGCGGTRALVSLLHLDFAAAYSYNQVLAAVVYPALLLLLLSDIALLVRRKITGVFRRTPLEYLVGMFDREAMREEAK